METKSARAKPGPKPSSDRVLYAKRLSPKEIEAANKAISLVRHGSLTVASGMAGTEINEELKRYQGRKQEEAVAELFSNKPYSENFSSILKELKEAKETNLKLLETIKDMDTEINDLRVAYSEIQEGTTDQLVQSLRFEVAKLTKYIKERDL